MVLFLTGKNRPTGNVNPNAVFEESEPVDAWDANLNILVKELLDSGKVDDSLKELHNKLASAESPELLLAIAQKWEASNYSLIAGYFYEKLAAVEPTQNAWQKAATNLFNIQSEFSDPEIRAAIASHSINAFQQVLTLDPDNLDAKADLAYCKLENGFGSPMEAVGVFQKNLETTPDHEKSLFYYGMALYRIGKIEQSEARMAKATNLFNKLVEAHPRAVYYQYLGELHYQLGNKLDAISSYEKHADLLTNEDAKRETQSIINKIKQEL